VVDVEVDVDPTVVVDGATAEVGGAPARGRDAGSPPDDQAQATAPAMPANSRHTAARRRTVIIVDGRQ
jgi:hypothetical protein